MINFMQLFVVSSLSVLLNVASAEYYIMRNSIPSSFFHKFDDIDEEIFPKDIRINVSISRMAGILLYSIDQNFNQLIVSLSDEKSNMLQVELNTVVMNISLSKLCGCLACLYKALDLRIEIGYQIKIQCNGGRIRKFENKYKIDLNNDYPIPFDTKNQLKSTPNKSYLWLVNVDQFKSRKFHPKQMYGCIFNVSYNGRPIPFKRISSSIEKKCTKSCSDYICNGGQCLEIYNEGPLCDCSSVKLGGRYCNVDLTTRMDNRETREKIPDRPSNAQTVKRVAEYATTIIIVIIIGIIINYFRKKGIRKISSSELIFMDFSIGEGNFGEVKVANLNGRGLVAVKIVKTLLDGESKENEANTLHGFNHKRIIKLIGVNNNPDYGLCHIVMDFMCNGPLLTYLIKSNGFRHSESKQVKMMRQISEGMEYLESKKCIHRDLRAMNILLNKKLKPKISDFGLAITITDDCIIDPKVRFPIFWMSPEALFEHKFSVKSDVWSFGVLMYEIVSCGRPLFTGLDPIIFPTMIALGYRLPQTHKGHKMCSDRLFNIMKLCWSEDPRQRPSFRNLRETLKKF